MSPGSGGGERLLELADPGEERRIAGPGAGRRAAVRAGAIGRAGGLGVLADVYDGASRLRLGLVAAREAASASVPARVGPRVSLAVDAAGSSFGAAVVRRVATAASPPAGRATTGPGSTLPAAPSLREVAASRAAG